MKQVLVLATLLMVGCGGNQSENNTTEQSGTKKMSAQMADSKKLPEMKMIVPQSAPIKIETITAEKNIEYINSKGITLSTEE